MIPGSRMIMIPRTCNDLHFYVRICRFKRLADVCLEFFTVVFGLEHCGQDKTASMARKTKNEPAAYLEQRMPNHPWLYVAES